VNKRVSIKDIANKVGVSTALVSYVLNGKEKEARVGKEMAKKIRKAAEQLNYQPNLIAKSLKSGKTHTLGLIVTDISNPFFSNIARIVEDEADRHGYTLIIGSSDENAEKSRKLIETMISRQVDGLIIVPAEGSEAQIERLVRDKFPLVLIDRDFPGIQTNSVTSDNFNAAFEAVSYLCAHGYKRIGLVTYDAELENIKDRQKGYREALKKYRLKAAKSFEIAVRYEEVKQDLSEKLLRLIEPDLQVDAIFFATNSLAIEGLRLLRAHNISIPEDLSIVSFDETDAFDFLPSAIPFVRQNLSGIGAEAVKLLLIGMGTQKAPVQIKVAAELVR